MTVEDDDDLDIDIPEWDSSQMSFMTHMAAGSIAGLCEHLSTFPMDTLKTHIQCERCGSNSPTKIVLCAKRIVKRDGLFRLWRGVTAMLAGCIPAHAAYFSVFESLKALLQIERSGHHPLRAAACGAAATFTHDMIMTPFDVVKQRMQLGYYTSMHDCGVRVLKTEGIRAFYVSLPTTLAMNVPYGCVMVATNESAKKILNPKGGFSFSTSMIAGCIAGAVAAAVTNPLDVVKTRLQTLDLRPIGAEMSLANVAPVSASSSMKYRTAFQTFQHIVAEEGLLGLTRGVLPRIIVQAPAVAISWTSYEGAKVLLNYYSI